MEMYWVPINELIVNAFIVCSCFPQAYMRISVESMSKVRP